MNIQDYLDTEQSVSTESSDHVLIAYSAPNNLNENEISDDLCDEIYNTWKGCLSLVPIDAISDNEEGLRQPQVSALFEILAHLTGHTQNAATVVMPTGTGKTETMLAAICGLPAKRSLVIVPTDSLRRQTFIKFLTLGKLKELDAIDQDVLNPVVAVIEGGIEMGVECDIALKANIIVTTPQSLNVANQQAKTEIYENCTHLFVDEAHHVRALTWTAIKQAFHGKPIIQFTATPFREDRKKVDGNIIYNYPISQAQASNLFRSITFKSIYEVNDEAGDIRIAEAAVQQLQIDLKNGLDHILMARCATKKRAESIFEIYQKNYNQFNPIVMHAGVKNRKQKLNSIVQKQHRIIVCINMLGEGFDLPELKVCAMHDIHKSLAITLQFTGRFVRDRDDLGNPTFIANVCDQKVEGVLKDLYLEDPDWNKVLQYTSETQIQKEIDFQELADNVIASGIVLPLENLRPASSALVYRTSSGKFNFDIDDLPLDKKEELISSVYAPNANLLILLTKIEIETNWAPQSNFTQPELRLIIVYGYPEQNLLFLHDSSKSSSRKNIAEKVGTNSVLINGDQVFKCFGNIERLVLQNAGLNRGKRGPLRYVMYTGVDIESAISDLAQGSSYKSNLFGKGYENGDKASIGCSYKGRIWAMNKSSISDWMEWCRNLGNKLNNPQIDPNLILDKVLRTREISELPNITPIGIDWPDVFFEHYYSAPTIEILGTTYNFDDVEIELIENNPGSVIFSVRAGEQFAEYEYLINDDGYTVNRVSEQQLFIEARSNKQALENYFSTEASPSIYFADGSKVFGCLHIIRPEGYTIPHFRRELLESWEWSVNIRNESQGEEKRSDSIQFAVFERLLSNNYSILFDDDGAHEIGDIIAFKEENDVLIVEIYHIKFSSSDTPGARVGDFYAVCCQAIKSCKWIGEFETIVEQLKKRERSRINRSNTTRFTKGEFRDLDQLKQHGSRLRKDYKIFIIQPGLDTHNPSDDVLALLGSTDLYIRETTNNPLTVIGS